MENNRPLQIHFSYSFMHDKVLKNIRLMFLEFHITIPLNFVEQYAFNTFCQYANVFVNFIYQFRQKKFTFLAHNVSMCICISHFNSTHYYYYPIQQEYKP